MYSKASRYTASSCTDLDNTRFWIGSKNFWDARFLTIFPLAARFCTILHKFCTILHDFALFCTIFDVSNWASIFISVLRQRLSQWDGIIHIFIQLCFHKIFMIRHRTVYKMKKSLVKAEVHKSRNTKIISPHCTLWLSFSF